MRRSLNQYVKEVIKNSAVFRVYEPAIYSIWYSNKYKRSYSQCGEDMILDFIFYNINEGYYVDIGANNPYYLSNTRYFYEKRWTGINIDATPGSMRTFRFSRRRDVNLEIPVSDIDTTMKYYCFNKSYLNTFSEEEAMRSNEHPISTPVLNTRKLSWVLDKYCNKKIIDFMSIDTEGHDFNVLKSNDWSKYRPKVIIIEMNRYQNSSNEITEYLRSRYYTICYQTPLNAFFLENEFLKLRYPNIANT